MIRNPAVYCVALLTLATPAWSAGRPAPTKAVKAVAKQSRAHAAKPAEKTETLTCRDGTEDRHARIGVVLRGGEVDSFAYYSKWKPRTCSIYLKRHGDPFSKWSSHGRATQVKTDRGQFRIERDGSAYRFVFNDVDRERYCGMDGKINGSLIVRKGSEHCVVSGIMEEGVPLGQAWAASQSAAAAAPAVAAQQAVPPARVAQRSHSDSVYTFQSGVTE